MLHLFPIINIVPTINIIPTINIVERRKSLLKPLLSVMRAIFLFTLLSIVIPTAFGAGGSTSSSEERNTPSVEHFDKPYVLELRPPIERERYARMLRTHILDEWKFPDVEVSNFQPAPLTESQLRANLNYNRNLRRFLYLQSTYTGLPDMDLATPIHGEAQEGGTHIWVLLTVHRPVRKPTRLGQVTAHGFVTVTKGDKVMRKLGDLGGPGSAALESGHALTMEEVFEQLPMLRSASWKGVAR